MIKAAYIKNLSLFLLLAIGFLFFHSELGLMPHDEGDHHAHDFCLIVNDITVQNSTHHGHQYLQQFRSLLTCTAAFFPLHAESEGKADGDYLFYELTPSSQTKSHIKLRILRI